MTIGKHPPCRARLDRQATGIGSTGSAVSSEDERTFPHNPSSGRVRHATRRQTRERPANISPSLSTDDLKRIAPALVSSGRAIQAAKLQAIR